MDFHPSPNGANPTRAEPNWPPVVVGGAFQTGLNLMRDLLGHGVRTVAVDYDLTHQGFRSVYGETHHCPNPDSDGPGWLSFMKALSEKLGQRPVFIPAADIFVIALGKYGSELAGHYLNSPEAASLQAELSSKETQYALCAQQGIICPRLAFIQSRADLNLFLAEAHFPCLIKPLSPREWDGLPPDNPGHGKKIVMAQTADELARAYDQVAIFRPEAVAQEVIPGFGDRKLDYIAVFGEGGRLLGHCMMRHARAYPIYTGMPPVVRPVEEDGLAELFSVVLRKLRYRGICECEFKIDLRDGKPRLIEMNPRFSGTGDSAKYSGVETGWLHYLDVIGYPVTPVKATRFDFHHIALQIEAKDTPPYVFNGSIPWKDFFAPYSKRRAYFDLDWHDRRLALETVRKCARFFAGGVLRHIRGKSNFA